MKLNKLTAVLSVIALSAGGAASYGAKSYITSSVSDYRSALDAEFEKVKVVVAATDLPKGVSISAQNLGAREVPKAFLHKDSITVEQWGDFQGRLTRALLTGGAPILKSQLFDPATAGFSESLEEGKRALTVPVDQISSISGLLAPGDRVDILFSLSRNRVKQTIVLMTDIRVLATGITTEHQQNNPGRPPPNGFNTVTLLVDPEQAAKLVHAREEGTLSVVLRSKKGDVGQWPERTTLANLLGEPKPRLKPRPTATKPEIQVILGGTKVR